jgi:hypothetical protein
MKMRKRRFPIPVWIIAAILVAAAIVSIGLSKARSQREAARPIALTFALDRDDPAVTAALQTVLGDFSSLYPRIQVKLGKIPDRATAAEVAEARADVIARTGPEAQGDSCFQEPSIPWTGSLWVLAARKDYLDAAASRQKEAVEALRGGKASGAQFELLLDDAAKHGLSPITLGNDYRWPFILWLQHWVAATRGPGSAAILPAPPGQAASSGGAQDPYADIRPAFADLMRWKDKGWFDRRAWDQGWAQGYAPLDKGQAAFALISADRLSAITPEGRVSLEYLGFPHRPQDGSWSIGAACYLGVAKGSREPEASRLLVKFLSSPGVTSRLAELTARPFFSWEARTGASPTVLADWSNAALSPAYAALDSAFDPGK